MAKVHRVATLKKKGYNMKISIFIALVLSGCATTGGGSFFDPTMVGGNERYVTYRDDIGIPGRMDQMANAHCQKVGRVAQFQSRVGAAFNALGETPTCAQPTSA